MNSPILAEIKRRKIFRVAVVYAATAFAVLQAADLLAAGLRLPEWVFPVVTVLVVVGFPVALVLGWALELTPEGLRVTEARATAEPGESLPSLLGHRTVLIAALLVAVGVGLGAGLVLGPTQSTQPRGDEPLVPIADKSIAVLPFADFSPDSGREWFSDGLAEEILNALARLPDLRVASRTGSFQFRGHGGDVRAIADSLAVAHILEGSVRHTGDRVRITAQLIRASDNVHLWAQNFERDAGDVIRVQEEIAYEIARTLQTALDPDELARMVAAGTNSVAAYEAYLRAWHAYHRSRVAEQWPLQLEQISALDEAIRHDPRFSRAHHDAAVFWMNQLAPLNRAYGIGSLSYAERHARASERLRDAEATAADPVSRLRAARLRAQLELRLDEAVQLGRRILELQPTGEEWLLLGADAKAAGQYELARHAFEHAGTRQNELLRGRFFLAGFHYRVDPHAALALIDDALRDGSLHLEDLYQAHRIVLATGRVEQAASLAQEYLARSTNRDGLALLRLRQLCGEGRTGEADSFFAALPAELMRDQPLVWLMLNILGRTGEAVDVLRPMDEAGELYALSTFLGYSFFDPRPYPNLSAALRGNGSLRAQTLPIPYQCPRQVRGES